MTRYHLRLEAKHVVPFSACANTGMRVQILKLPIERNSLERFELLVNAPATVSGA